MHEPSNLSYEAISGKAFNVGKFYGAYDDTGIVNMAHLLRVSGGTTELAPRNPGVSLHVHNVGEFTVYVPRLTSPRQDRFTTARAIGHYFLHYLRNGVGEEVFPWNPGRRMEAEAVFFAAGLVMPEQYFVRGWERLDGDVLAMSRLFDVSPRAVCVRANHFHLGSARGTLEPGTIRR